MLSVGARQSQNRFALGAFAIHMRFPVSNTVFRQLKEATDSLPKAEKDSVLAATGGNVVRHSAEDHIAEGCHLEQPYPPKIRKKINENEQYRESEKHEIQVVKSVYSRKGARSPSSDRQARLIPPILEITHLFYLSITVLLS